MMEANGRGRLLICSYGAITRYDLAPGEKRKIGEWMGRRRTGEDGEGLLDPGCWLHVSAPDECLGGPKPHHCGLPT